MNCQVKNDNKCNFVCLYNYWLVILLFYDNYVRLCNFIGKTPSAVALEIGIAKPTVTRWKQGSKPNRATEIKVADYFGVSVSELTGEEKKNKPAPESEHIGPAKQKLLDAVDDLSPAEMAILFERIQKIKESRI